MKTTIKEQQIRLEDGRSVRWYICYTQGLRGWRIEACNAPTLTQLYQRMDEQSLRPDEEFDNHRTCW